MREFFRKVKWACQRVVRGWDDSAIWDLDNFLSNQIIETVKHLRDKGNGVPNEMFGGFEPDENGAYSEEEVKIAKERWQSILDEIIDGFTQYRDTSCMLGKSTEKLDRAFFLLHEYFQNLWD